MRPPPDTPPMQKKITQQRYDSWGNPTNKKPGDVGTEIGFGKNPKWLDMKGKNQPHSSKEWRK